MSSTDVEKVTAEDQLDGEIKEILGKTLFGLLFIKKGKNVARIIYFSLGVAPLALLFIFGVSMLDIPSSILFFLNLIIQQMLLLLRERVKRSYKEILHTNEETEKEMKSLLNDPDDLVKLKEETNRNLSSRRSEFIRLYPAIFILSLPFLLISAPPSEFDFFGVYLNNIGIMLISILLWIALIVGVSLFLSAMFMIEKINDFVVMLFDKPEKTKLIADQKLSFNQCFKKDRENLELPLFFPSPTSYHHGFLTLANSFVRKSRGLFIVVIVSLIQLFSFIWVMTFSLSTSNIDTHTFIGLLVTFSLLFVLFVALADYINTEWKLHRVLLESRNNLVSLYDAALLNIGLSAVSSSVVWKKETKRFETEDVKVLQSLLEHSSRLPTWTFDAKIAGTILATVVIQLTVLVMSFMVGIIGITP